AVARVRRAAGDSLGLERACDSAVVGVGGARPASIELPLSASFELVAAPRRGGDFRRTSFEASNATGAIHRQHADFAVTGAFVGATGSGRRHLAEHAMGGGFWRGLAQPRAATDSDQKPPPIAGTARCGRPEPVAPTNRSEEYTYEVQSRL